MSGEVDKLREAGFTETEISDWGSQKSGELSAAGFTQPEIDSYLGVKPIDVGSANKSLAKSVTAAINNPNVSKATKQLGHIVADSATVYAPIEAATNLATGAILGFPAYLGGGVGTLIARGLGLSDDDPKEVAQRYADAVTYTPRTDAGTRLTDVATMPLKTLMDVSEKAGKAVAEKTESPTAAAITEATIQMLPSFLIPAFGKALKGKVPTNSDMYVNAKDLSQEAPHATVNEIADKIQTTYEKSGIDPETVKQHAIENPTVLQDLVSDNHDVPRAMAAGNTDATASVTVPSIGKSLQERVDNDFPALRKEYEALAERDANSEGGNIISTDIARELSPEYRADRSLSADVHEAASAFAKKLYEEKLKELPPDSKVIFTAGGTGAGKSTAIKGFGKDLTYDTNMNRFNSATEKIDQAINAGHKVELNYVYREPVDSLVDGSLTRAERMGRTVPINEHAKTHQGSFETIHKLTEHYKDNPNVTINIIDNSRGKGNAAIVNLEDLPKQDYNNLERNLNDALEKQHKEGRISEKVYAATKRVGEGNVGKSAQAQIAQQTVLDRVSVGESTSKAITVEEVYTAAKDDLYPIAKIEEKLSGGASLDTAESPYALARLTRGSSGKATQFLDYGTFDFKTYKNTGEGLKQILEPVQKDIDGFRAYAVAKRSAELEARGIKTGVPQEEAAQVIAAGGKYAEPFKKLQDYQNALVKYLKDSGVVSDEAYKTMVEANQNYVPFHRLFSEEKGGIGKGFNVNNPIKAIKGSERTIVDPLESIIKNTYLYTALAERNAVGAAFGKLVEGNKAMAEDLGVSRVKQPIRPIEVSEKEVQKFLDEHGIEGDAAAFNIFRPNAMRPAPNQIRYFENGKPVTLEVPEGVADAFNATDQQSAGMLLKMLAVPSKTLRAGSVLSPDFMARNVIRDQLTAFMFSKNGYIPVWDMMSGLYSFATKDMAFQNWLKSGGANSTLVSMDRQYLQQHLTELDKSTGLMSRTFNLAKTPLEVLRIVSEMTENATRLGDFKKAGAGDKAAIQDAGFNSREVTLDFARMGAQTRGLNMIAAFMNAGLEGLDRTARAFKDAPIGTTAKVAAGITLPSVLLWYANHDDPRYKEIPQWEKDLFWIAMTDDHIYRIPKPFEVGVIFGSVPERMMDKFAADNPDAFKNFSSTLTQAFGINVFPTFAVPPLEQLTNHSFFTGNPLIPDRMEGILPEYQYNEYTSELSKKVGSLIGAFPGFKQSSISSPIVIDNYIRGWTGSVGAYVRDILDKGLRSAGVLPDPPQPISTLADIPVVKAFVVRYPSASAQSVQDFYDAYSSRKTVYDTFQYLVKNNDPDAAIKEAELAPEAFAQMDGINDSIAELNTNIRMVYKNPDISPSDQRQLIDSMYGQMIELARVGNETMNEVDKVLGK